MDSPRPRFIFDEAAGQVLDDPRTPWSHSDRPYVLPDPLRGQAETLVAQRADGSPWENEDKLSLAASPAAVRSLITVTASYFDQLATHEQPTTVSCSGPVSGFWQDSTGAPLDFEHSRFPNPLGGTVLVVCSDNCIVLGTRSRSSLIKLGRVDPTASGSFRVPRWSAALSARELLVGEALRELTEEMCVPEQTITDVAVIAFSRDMERCGKPDVHLFARTDLSSRNLIPSSDMNEAEVIGPVQSTADLAEVLAGQPERSSNLDLWLSLTSSPSPRQEDVMARVLQPSRP